MEMLDSYLPINVYKPHAVSTAIPGLQDALSSSEITSEMAKKITRALNLLGADRHLLNSDADTSSDRWPSTFCKGISTRLYLFSCVLMNITELA